MALHGVVLKAKILIILFHSKPCSMLNLGNNFGANYHNHLCRETKPRPLVLARTIDMVSSLCLFDAIGREGLQSRFVFQEDCQICGRANEPLRIHCFLCSTSSYPL